MATNDIGRVTPIWRGFYSAATTYELNDIVIDTAGSVWWHKSEEITTGVAPGSGEIWDAVIDMSIFSGLIQAAITTAQTALAAAQAALADVAADMERAETAADNAENSAAAASESAAGVGALAQAAAASAEAAAGSATGAAGSAQAAAGSKSDAEAYAVGTRGGEDVETTDPTYHNNAKYYAEQAASEAEAAAQSAEDAQDVLNSIPEDYSQLSADVGDLKTQLNDVIQKYGNLLYSGIWNDYSAIHGFVGDTIEVAAKNTGTYRMCRCDIDVSNIDNVTISWASKSSESGTEKGALIRYGFTTSPESNVQTWKGYIANNPYTIDVSNENWLRIGLYVDQNSVAQGTKAIFVKIQAEEGTEATEFTKNGYSAVDFIARKNVASLNDYVEQVGIFSSANNIVRTVAHRGDDIIAPQCTAPSYIVARNEGFAIAENDVYMSKDGYLVMWHDSNLNRLGNLVDINGYLIYTDGTNFYYVNESVVYTWNGTDYITSAVPLSSLTRCAGADFSVTTINFNDLRRIDFGVYKNAKYAGTQILTFKEWVMLCKQLGMEIYIDKKVTYTDAQLTETAETVRECGMGKYASWLSLNVRQINLVKAIVPDARFGTLQHPNAEAIETYSAVNVGRGFFFNGDAKNGLTLEAVQLGLNAGFEVETYYVDFGSATEETVLNKIREAVSYGCTGITTDHYKVNDAYKYLIDMY